MQHHNMGSDFHFSLKLDLEKVLARPQYKKYFTIIRLAKKFYDFKILVFLSKLNNLKTEALKWKETQLQQGTSLYKTYGTHQRWYGQYSAGYQIL
jgi:hypothetical protein